MAQAQTTIRVVEDDLLAQGVSGTIKRLGKIVSYFSSMLATIKTPYLLLNQFQTHSTNIGRMAVHIRLKVPKKPLKKLTMSLNAGDRNKEFI
jgi:hypothetical protein